MLCYAMLCYAMLCYAMLCYAMLCYAMLCYAMLCSIYGQLGVLEVDDMAAGVAYLLEHNIAIEKAILRRRKPDGAFLCGAICNESNRTFTKIGFLGKRTQTRRPFFFSYHVHAGDLPDGTFLWWLPDPSGGGAAPRPLGRRDGCCRDCRLGTHV
jgi:hypothetical protein